MDDEKQRAIARAGGRSVPDEKRSFSQDRQLASEAGRKGGRSVPGEKRSFSQDRRLAAAAGRKGGEARGESSGRGSEDPGSSARGPETRGASGSGRFSHRDDH
jgi:hypothetical protein